MASCRRVSRRQLLGAGAGVGATAFLSGCFSSINLGVDGEENGFTIAGVMVPEGSDWEGEQPSGFWELERRLSKRDGIQVNVVGEGQICGEQDCPDRVAEGVVDVASASMGNSSGSWPMNDIFLLPYTFPNNASLPYTLTQEETWDEYWIPFAREYGVLPFYYFSPHLRQLHIGTDAANQRDEPYTAPSDTDGLKIRRTQSAVASIAIEAWGADPVSVGFSDTVQGLRTGVVDGIEMTDAPMVAFGYAESVGETIRNNWTIHNQSVWFNVDWMKGLSQENQEILAEETKKLYEDLVHMTQEIEEERLGTTDPPQEGTALAEQGIQQNHLDDDQIQEWIDDVHPLGNRELYRNILDHGDKIGIDGEAFHEYLWDTARENSVPSSTSDFSVDTWWDDVLQEI